MDTLNGTSWDVVIAGTGLQPALLALALSRSNKKILHLDSNDHYGGREAALSITEIESWVDRQKTNPSRSPFRNASIIQPPSTPEHSVRLAAPRAYSLSLSPCVLYTRSALLLALVSSKAHEQLEFLAVGSWFVYQQSAPSDSGSTSGQLVRVPNSREDIFSNPALTLRAKGALVKFLRFVAVYQEEQETWTDWKNKSFADFLVKKFRISPDFHGPLLALSMSSKPDDKVTTDFALANIHRHLTSMGVFGAGFSAVLPKYGGLSEVVQVACRAAAVGGAVYVLNRGIDNVDAVSDEEPGIQVVLQGGDKFVTSHLIGTHDQLPKAWNTPDGTEEQLANVCARSISVVSSTMDALFPRGAEGSPPPSAAVVVYPSGTIAHVDGQGFNPNPIHVLVHSADTGECPKGQCVIYAMTSIPLGDASPLLEIAVQALLTSIQEAVHPLVLWTVKYEIVSQPGGPSSIRNEDDENTRIFLEPPSGPVFDDGVVESVKQAWQIITGEPEDSFMRFVDRNVEPDEGGAVDEIPENTLPPSDQVV
ncbi:putative rab geranylgeranyl transferase escort protein [Elsinoe ampelina]|uniref:Rab proteins geranylgeranyltransferase n=1 Tax=Elsinoe ampelina TaxID=302913 RepID=A0A6A6FZ60_9PEZI|nr:putative rab geranylgeranyl transferase escort protein [Elsinoe ampelina]